METYEDLRTMISDWASGVTLAVSAIVGVLGLIRTVVDLGKKKRLRRLVERDLSIYQSLPFTDLKARYEEIIRGQVDRLLLLESTPILRRRDVRLALLVTLGGLSLAGRIYSRRLSDPTQADVLWAACTAILVAIAVHVALRLAIFVLSPVIRFFAPGLRHASRSVVDGLVRWLDRMAQYGLIREVAFRLGYMESPYSRQAAFKHAADRDLPEETTHIRPIWRRGLQKAPSTVRSDVDAQASKRARLEDLVEYLRTGA